jgi:hypothetical protein
MSARLRPFGRRAARAALLLGLVLLSGGCAAAVKPWDRDLLARPSMRFVPNPTLHAIDAHIYFSKEGSAGGDAVSGGGCGCN